MNLRIRAQAGARPTGFTSTTSRIHPRRARCPDRLKQIPDPADRYRLENYWLDHWNAHRIRLMIDEAADWGKVNHVPLLCNEFGVYRAVAEPASRLAWLRDVRNALESDSIGWAMWDYHEGFGVAVIDKDGKSVVDPDTAAALGLKQ